MCGHLFDHIAATWVAEEQALEWITLVHSWTFEVYNILSAKLFTSVGEFWNFDQNLDWQDQPKVEMTTNELQCRFRRYSQSFQGTQSLLGETVYQSGWDMASLMQPHIIQGLQGFFFFFLSDPENLQYCFHVVWDDSFSLQKVSLQNSQEI